MLIVDTAVFEKQLFSIGHRGPMTDPQSGKARAPKTMISLASLFRSLGVDIQCTFHNSGNDAFLSLLALQLLLDKDNTRVPQMRGKSSSKNSTRAVNRTHSGNPPLLPVASVLPMMMQPQLSPNSLTAGYSMNAYLDNESGMMRRTPGHSNNNTGSRRGMGGVGGNNSSRKPAVEELTNSLRNLKTE